MAKFSMEELSLSLRACQKSACGLGCEDVRDQQLQVVTKPTFVRGSVYSVAFSGVVYYSQAISFPETCHFVYTYSSTAWFHV